MSAITTQNAGSIWADRRLRAALFLWTVLVWGSRLRNIVNDGDLEGAELLTNFGVALFLLVAAIAMVVSLKRDLSWHGRALGVLVIAGITRFTIRGFSVLANPEWDTGFKVVHTVLWVVTVILSILAAREYSRVRSSAWVSS